MTRRLLLLVALAGCPAPRPAPAERPAPPPVALAPDAAPAPSPPSVVAVRASSGAAELVVISPDGDTRVLHVFRRRAGIADVKDLAVDGDHYAVLVEADTVDGASTGAPANVMSLVLGSLDSGAIAIGPADRGCVMHRCFESQLALSGDSLVTTQLRSKATDLARYPFAAAPRPTRLEPRAVEHPAFSPDLTQLAYQRGKSIYVAPLGSAASSPLATQPDAATLALSGSHLVVRTRSGSVDHIATDTGSSTSLARLSPDPHPIVHLTATDVLTTDGTSVVSLPLSGGSPRTLATGSLIDVSADGLWALVSDSGVLSIIPTSGGDPIARHELAAPFGNVRARLAR
jgi:hypothetical protein